MSFDTSKYEEHTEGHWTWMGEEVFVDEGPTIAHITSDNRADANLIADAPLLLEKVKRLSEELKQTRECLWWCYDLKRFGNEIKGEHWDFIGRLLGADTDHNDNEWGEEE